MRYFGKRLFILSTITLFSNLAYPSGFQLYELGTPIIGTAAVGQASVATDASVSYFNPAAMTQLPSSAFMLGSQLLLPYTNFSPSPSNTIPGNNGSNAGQLTPGVDMYFVYNLAPRWRAGLSLTGPYGGLLSYNDAWVGRYNVQQIQFYTLDLTPSIAYQVNNALSVAIGVVAEYANLNQTTAIRITPDLDGQIHVKADNTSPGINAAAYFTYCPGTKVGVIIRSQIIHNLRGNLTFLRIPESPSATARMVMPANAILSISQFVNSQITLLGEVGWAHWSAMKNTILNVGEFTFAQPLNWHDTYRVGVGGQFRTGNLTLQTGVSYDSSPTDTSMRQPVLPVDRQVRVAAGFVYTLCRIAQLGFSYEYISMGQASISNTSNVGVLAGSYSRNYTNVAQASINVEL